uniref:Uncharacterized protein n=1 Tax=viral metagenome TaxID=1070528 RepID=A0A6H2A1N8_9ZZZZ
MRTIIEIEEKIKKLRRSLKSYSGDDEFASERIGWLDALLWILEKQPETIYPYEEET